MASKTYLAVCCYRYSCCLRLCPHLPVLGRLLLGSNSARLQHFVERLGIHNQVLGYLYLVDSAGNIRWR